MSSEIDAAQDGREGGAVVHDLKLVDPFFGEVFAMRKNFEVRKLDRDYKVGDILRLHHYDPNEPCFVDGYSGAMEERRITYIITHEMYPDGIKEGYAVLGIAPLPVQAKTVGEVAREIRESLNNALPKHSNGDDFLGNFSDIIIARHIDPVMATGAPERFGIEAAWTAVEDGLPKCGEELDEECYYSTQSALLIAMLDTGHAITARFLDDAEWVRIDEDGEQTFDFYVTRKVTHWMYLPVPPKAGPL